MQEQTRPNEKNVAEKTSARRERKYSATISPEEHSEKIAFVKMRLNLGIQTIANSEKRQFFNEHLEEISKVIAETLLETASLLHIPDLPLIVIDPDENSRSFMAFGSMDRKMTMFPEKGGKLNWFKISTHALEELANAVKSNDAILMASFRSSLAHEMFHYYADIHYPTASEKTKIAGTYGTAEEYQRDRGEIAADIFAMYYLLNRDEQDDEQRSANQLFAGVLKDGLDKKTRKNSQQTEKQMGLTSLSLFQRIKKFFIAT